jgi:hypothetical protein
VSGAGIALIFEGLTSMSLFKNARFEGIECGIEDVSSGDDKLLTDLANDYRGSGSEGRNSM